MHHSRGVEKDRLRSEIINHWEATRKLIEWVKTGKEAGLNEISAAAIKRQTADELANLHLKIEQYKKFYQPDDPEILSIADSIHAEMSLFGTTEWLSIQEIAQSKVADIQTTIENADKSFKEGKFQEAGTLVDHFIEAGELSPKLQELKKIMLLTSQFMEWQESHAEELKGQIPLEGLLQQLHQFSLEKIPLHYWNHGQASSYLRTIEKQTAEYLSRNQRRKNDAQVLENIKTRFLIKSIYRNLANQGDYHG